MAFDIDRHLAEAYGKVDKVPEGYIEYRLTYAPEGYVYCALGDGEGVYVRKQADGSLAYEGAGA